MTSSIDPGSEDPFVVSLNAEGLRRSSMMGSLVTVLSTGIKMIIQLGAQVILARLLFPSDFGLLAMVAPAISFVQIFADIGLGQAVVQRQALSQERVSTLFWVSIALGFGLAFLASILAPLAAWAYHEPRVLPLIIALGWMIPLKRARYLTDRTPQ